MKKIIDNLHEDYQKNLRFLPLSTYRSLYEVGVNIEDYMIKKEPTNSNDSWKEKKNDNPSSSKSTNLSNDNINNVWAIDNHKPRRTLTPIEMSYDIAFDRLCDRNLIKPIGPTEHPAPEKRSSRWNPNSYCKYHRGNGHTTDECFRLQNLIQDLIDTGKLLIPPPTKNTV